MNREVFGANLRDVREFRGWTQHELAARLGLTNTMVSFYETGRNVPTLARFAALCSTLGVGASDLLAGAYPEPQFPPPAPNRLDGADEDPDCWAETAPRIDF